MRLYIFRCRARPGIYAATRFETASNLPREECSGGWAFYERVDLTPKGRLRFAVDATRLRRQVQQNGWYMWEESAPEWRLGIAPEDRLVRRDEERPPAEHESTAGLGADDKEGLTDRAAGPASPARSWASAPCGSVHTGRGKTGQKRRCAGGMASGGLVRHSHS